MAKMSLILRIKDAALLGFGYDGGGSSVRVFEDGRSFRGFLWGFLEKVF